MKKLKLPTSVISNCIHWFRSWNVLNKSIHLNLFLNYYQKNTMRCMDFLRRDRDFCLSESLVSRRDREYIFLNLRVRDWTGFLSYKSRGSRRERDFFFQNLMFREENENYKMKSHGWARKNEANSRENSRDQEFSLVSGLSRIIGLDWLPSLWACSFRHLKSCLSLLFFS